MTRWLGHPMFAPALVLLALGWGTALDLLLLLGPNLGGWTTALLTSCFGWNAATRAYRLDVVLPVTLQPPLFAIVVGVFYADELRAFVRRLGGRLAMGAAALGFAAAALALVTTGDVVGVPAASGAPPVRDGRPAPRARLTDHRGQPFELGAPLDRPVALTFVYTGCHASCPALIATLKSAAARVGDRAVFAAVTMAPEKDTTPVLAASAAEWNLDGRWHLLTGERRVIDRLLAAYRVQTAEVAGGELAHENVVVVIDRAGRLAFTYRGLGPGMAELAGVLDRLAAERG